MSITKDNSTSYNGTSALTTHTFTSHSVSGSNLVGIFSIQAAPQSGSTPPTVSSVSFNGSAGTYIIRKTGGAGTYFASELWYISSPATGAHTVSVTLDRASYVVIQFTTYTGVAASPIGATNSLSDNGTTNSPSLSLTTTASSSIIVDSILVNHNSGGLTQGGSQTLNGTNYNSAITFNGGASYLPTTTTGSYSLSWSFANPDAHDFVIAEIKQYVVNYTLTASNGSYTYTGYNAILHYGKKIIAQTGSYTLTGYSAVLTLFQKWIKQSKNTSVETNGSKNTSTWVDQSKNTSSETNQTKN